MSELLNDVYLSKVREVAESSLDDPEKKWLAQAACVLGEEIYHLREENELLRAKCAEKMDFKKEQAGKEE